MESLQAYIISHTLIDICFLVNDLEFRKPRILHVFFEADAFKILKQNFFF